MVELDDNYKDDESDSIILMRRIKCERKKLSKEAGPPFIYAG